MLRKEILDTLQVSIGQVLGEEKVIAEDDLLDYRGIGLNSIQLLTIVVLLEDNFDFVMDDNDLDMSKFSDVKSIINYVESSL